MNDLIKALEKQHRAVKGEAAQYQRDMNDALDAELDSLADAHDRMRHYHMGKTQALGEVLKALKALAA